MLSGQGYFWFFCLSMSSKIIVIPLNKAKNWFTNEGILDFFIVLCIVKLQMYPHKWQNGRITFGSICVFSHLFYYFLKGKLQAYLAGASTVLFRPRLEVWLPSYQMRRRVPFHMVCVVSWWLETCRWPIYIFFNSPPAG